MRPLPRWLTFGILPVVVFCDAFSWYAMYSLIALHLNDAGMSVEQVGTLLSISRWLIVGATLVGGILAIGTGPWILLGAGALIASAGLGLMSLSTDTATVGLALAAIGHGLMRPGLWGAAARAFEGRHEPMRNGLFVLLWGSTNVAALISPAASASARSALDFTAITLVGALLVSFAMVLAVIGGGVTWHVHRHDPPEPGFAIQGRHALAVGGIVLLAGLPWGAYGLVYRTLDEAFRHLPVAQRGLWYSINPTAVSVVAGLLCVVFVVLFLLKKQVPTLLFAGIGMALVGIGAAVLGLASSGIPSMPLVLAGILISALGEVMAGPLLISRIAGDMPKRLVCLAPALWLFVTGAMSSVLFAAVAAVPDIADAAIWVIAALSFVVGAVFAAGAYPARKLFPS